MIGLSIFICLDGGYIGLFAFLSMVVVAAIQMSVFDPRTYLIVPSTRDEGDDPIRYQTNNFETERFDWRSLMGRTYDLAARGGLVARGPHSTRTVEIELTRI